MKNFFGKIVKTKKSFLLLGSVLPLLLVGFAVADGQSSSENTLEKTFLPPSPSETKPLTKEEFAAALASKIQLMKLRTNQLKAINGCFFRVSDIALKAGKKGEKISQKKAMELVEAEGLSEASKIENLPFADLARDPYVANKIQRLLTLSHEKANPKIEAEFLRLENEIRADIELAKGLGIDVSPYKNDLSDYARTRIESVMWLSIFKLKLPPKK